MGAFHEGHLSLMRASREECDKVVVSLFVNPLQFGPREDLAKYPRDENRDADLARSSGVDVLFIPSLDEMYPRTSTIIHVPEVTERWEGSLRPGHFDGVATVVFKLFNMVRPQVAYFGLKDLQQCQVVRRMAEDLDLRIVLRFMPTIRENDGLAMSSRNAYLDSDARELSPAIYQALLTARNEIEAGVPIEKALTSARGSLGAKGMKLDYLALVNLPDMEEIKTLPKEGALIVAARVGKTRLIDNVLIPG